MSLQGKTFLITGSAGGLGRAIADHVFSLSANVVICDIDTTRLSQARSSYPEAHTESGRRLLFLQVDVTDPGSVESLISAATSRFGRLDVVVNNAGIMDGFHPAGACEVETWDRVMAVNLRGPFLVTKHAVQSMQQTQPPGGIIINIASVAAVHGSLSGAAYTAAKHGVLGLTRNTANYYGPKGIYCVALLIGSVPGTNILTAIQGELHREGLGLVGEHYPGEQKVPAEQVARYIAFLSQGMGETMNGSCVPLSGNWPVI